MRQCPETPAGKGFGNGEVDEDLAVFVGVQLGVKEGGFVEIGAGNDRLSEIGDSADENSGCGPRCTGIYYIYAAFLAL